MKLKGLFKFLMVFAIALLSYNLANAQIVEGAKKTVDKTKQVTKDVIKKTADKTEDVADKTEDVADKSKDVIVDASKKTVSGAKKIGNYTVELVDNVKGATYEGGRWLVVSTWDGAKWVSKRVWIPNKKKEKQ